MSPPYTPTNNTAIHMARIATVAHISGTRTRETQFSLGDWVEASLPSLL
jgi:hypothetical protein